MSSFDPARLPVNPCCDDHDPMPCQSCRDALADGISYEGHDPGVDLGWDAYDDERWTTKPPGLTMVEMVDNEALEYRRWSTDLGDILAERLEGLAAMMRALDARTPEGYRDRRETMLDAAGL